MYDINIVKVGNKHSADAEDKATKLLMDRFYPLLETGWIRADIDLRHFR